MNPQPTSTFQIRRDGALAPTLQTFAHVESALAAATVASQGQGGAVWHVVTGRYAGIVAASVSARGTDVRVTRS